MCQNVQFTRLPLRLESERVSLLHGVLPGLMFIKPQLFTIHNLNWFSFSFGK